MLRRRRLLSARVADGLGSTSERLMPAYAIGVASHCHDVSRRCITLLWRCFYWRLQSKVRVLSRAV
jgi:hypothetical protein